MSKFIISMLNTLLCVLVIAICIICVGVTENWKDCTIAIIIILGGAHFMAVLLNRVLPHKLHILDGILELVGGPLLVIGAIVCIDVFEPWPLKIIGMLAWVILIFFGPSILSSRR
ncbi:MULTISPECIES: hypothetical protein [Enterobacter]|uniref:hypothetical protein n=1 Tax=Enterobacter TaxID=547 RepID=UPI0028EF3237|nr:hypothetical protein [Enterobacter cloacae]HDR2792928.1 hypothetical protein [Enterobacter asburiae]WNT37014.1 hypothetical protein RRL13_02530 [Enterobacter cloacae]HDR2796714.1 hypothetical protein [Enterobacter asburiae]HDR2798035.1 hypothetical protein [Enterobacter asburiae]HDR2802231.1 hypothetical protein [Enterobacter asburiae]